MRLELDAGNSRLKWRLRSDRGERLSGGVLSARAEPDAVAADLLLYIDAALPVPQAVLSSIRVASVRDAGFREVLSASLSTRFGQEPQYAEVRHYCAGVHNAYADVTRMGIDRWLAMLAAFRACQRPCCIVDAGSAMTVDIIADGGRHQGGYILPGLNMMLESLAARSSALRHDDERQWGGVAPGRDTRSAMSHGALNMALGMLERVAGQWPDMEWFLSGGDAPLLADKLGWACAVVPELVMDGLELACGDDE